MRNARNGGVLDRPQYPVIGDDRTWTRPMQRPHMVDPKESLAGTTAMAAAFARAVETRKLDMALVPKTSNGEAREMFTDVRWAETDGRAHCIYCNAEKPYVISSRPGWFRCRYNRCNRHFSLTSKTVFASHKMPLQGCLVALGAVVDDGGLRAVQLAETLGVTYRAAWALGQKLGLPTRDERLLMPRQRLNYPYKPKPTPEKGFDLLMAINGVVDRNLPEHMRADVCQEIALGVLCGDYQRDNLASAYAQEKAKYNRIWREGYDYVSLDKNIYGEPGGVRFIDRITSDREHW